MAINPDYIIPVDLEKVIEPIDVGGSLSQSVFNGIISMFRNFVQHTDSFRITDCITGNYGTYIFDLDDVNVLDNGILINEETIQAEPCVKLEDNLFRYSTYTLKLQVLHFSGVNILDDLTPSDFKVVDTLEVELVPNEWIDIPLSVLDTGFVVSFDAMVEIKHDKTEIHCIDDLNVDATPNIIQVGEKSDIFCQLIDYGGYPYDINDGIGKTVYFFERLTPTFKNMIAIPNPIQTGETTDISVKVNDADGSIAQNMKTHFYSQNKPAYVNNGTNVSTLTVPSDASVTVVDNSLKITTSTTGEKNIYYPISFTSNDNFIVECKVAKLGAYQSIAMYIRNSTTANGCWFAYEDSTSKWGGGCTGTNFNNVTTGALQVGDKITIKQENGVITLYHNDKTIYSKTTNLSGTYYVGHYTNKDREQYVTDIKIWKE